MPWVCLLYVVKAFPGHTHLTLAFSVASQAGRAGLLLRTGGPNNWVNIDMEYSIIVINVSRV